MNTKLYSLTNPQKSIWLTEKFYQATSINTICGYVHITDEVNFDVLKNAINEMVKTNDGMRIRIKEENNLCIQYVSDFKPFNIDLIELSSKEEMETSALKMANTPFMAENEVLFQFVLFKLPNGSGGFIVNVHHLIGDSWSLGLIAKEVTRIYSELLAGTYEEHDYPSYLNYIEAENDYKNSDKYIKDKAYWDDVFSTIPEIASIPSTKKDSQKAVSCEGKREKFEFAQNELNKIKAFCDKYKISIYNFFMAVYSLYVSRITNLDDFVIGTPILNRTNFEQKHTMGMFISVAPLRVTLNYELSFVDFAKKIATNTMSTFRHQKYSYQTILEDIRKRDSSIPNLYNVVLSYQITKTVEEDSEVPYSTDWIFNGNSGDELQIHLFDLNDEDSMTVAYDYKAELFSEQEISNLHNRISTIIKQIISNETIPLKNIEIVTPEEKHKILYNFNNTSVDYPRDKTIVDLFEEQVEKTPDNIAVMFEDQKLTYRELNEKANQLARYLDKSSIPNFSTIGVLLKRSIDIYICMLGILKSNHSYMLIDYKLPKDRIEYMLKNSNSTTLLTSTSIDKNISINNLIYIDKIDFNPDNSNLGKKGDPSSPSCIIYTSGSTGTPKGVMLTHRGIVNMLVSYEHILHTNELHIFFSMSTVSFDMFAVETYIPLLSGGTIILTNEIEQQSPQMLQDLIIKNNAEFILTTPSKIELLMMDEEKNCLKNVKIIQLGGEIFNSTLYERLKKFTNANIYNGYGPTEITACCSTKKVIDSDISIGTPFCNTKIFICDNNLNLLPIGVVGELCVSGDGLALGYMNNEDLTKKSFVKPNFYDKLMYRTGDLAYWDKIGEIRFIGRNDNQVKLRGLRIELNEISSRIKEIRGVKNSIALIKEVNGNKSICAYISTNSSAKLSQNDIKTYLKQYLPEYMVPNFIMFLDEMPLTINGKIDTKKLPNIELDESQITRASTETEIKLENICKKYLSCNFIDVNTSLFDIGGDSLFAIKLSADIYNNFNVTVSVKDIFDYPTIKDLSDYISTLSEACNKNTIKKVEKRDYYPASSAQKRIYYASSIDNNSTLYNTAGGVIINKNLDINLLQQCFQKLINRHEVLRTHFAIIENEIVQVIEDKIDFTLTKETATSDDLNNIYANFVKPFDLTKAPLFRAKAVELEDNKMLLLLDMHHIISDGTSLSILLQELCDLYNGKSLPEKQVDYKDFSLWEKEQFETEEFKKSKDFWVTQFKDEIPLLNMPTTFARPSVQSFEGSNYHTKLPKEVFKKVNEVSKNLGITPYMLMLSVYYILLSKYTSQDDIVVGTPIVGRELPELSNMLGMFVNTLALRNKVDHVSSFSTFANSIKEYCLSAFQNQVYPFDELVKELNIKRDTSRNPLIDVMFIYQNNGYPTINFKDASVEYFTPNSNVSKFDLSLEIVPIDNELSLHFEYCIKLFDEDFIKRLSSHYINILSAILENQDIKIADIDMLSKEERNQILYDFNNTVVDYPRDKTIVDLFEEQVKKTPDNIAVVFEDKKLTYRELNEKANQLANILISKGISTEDVVGVYLTRCPELIVSIFGILKAGAVYMPMFTGYPVDRLNYMLNNSNSKCLISNSLLASNIETNISKILIDSTITAFSNTNLNISTSCDNLAYVIYTSGSTGKPKGVKITHKNLINFVYAFNNYYNGITFEDSFLASTNISFDVSIWEIFIPLLNGATLVLNTEEIISNIALYCKNIIKNRITALYIPPNILDEVYTLLSKNEKVYINKLLVGVEPIRKHSLNNYYNLNPDIIIVNGYGPTEATICSTALNYFKDTSNDEIVSIGKPLHNNKIYIIDSDKNLCPVGVSGELCISGDGVGKGYLNNELETKKLFVQNPFDSNNSILYKTGDLAKWIFDGTINFVGRIDNQIKLSGYRIELNEINNCINQYNSISSVFTTLLKNKNKDCIISYFTAKNEINTKELDNYLHTKLPFYMVPKFLMQIESFPLTPNGKIDAKKLPLPNFEHLDTYIAPETDMEKNISIIIGTLLGIDKISIIDNLFELGMDSLMCIKLSVKILEDQNVSLTVADIFEHPTIKDLSGYITTLSEVGSKSTIKKLEKRDYYPTSSAQKRIYYASSIDNDSVLYNIAGGIVIDKNLDINLLQQCFQTLIDRHEVLRTHFAIIENEIVQVIEDKIDFTLTKETATSDDLNNIYANFVKPFDLTKAPLFRAKAVELEDNKMLLLLDMHHIISDGTSLSILLQELCDLYNGKSLPEKQVDYKDFSLWEKEQFETEEFKKSKDFWVTQFKDEIPLLNMPTTFARPSVQSFEGSNYHTKLPKEVFEKVNEVSKNLGITPYMLMLSVYYILLSKYTSQDDIVVGTPIVGRELPELSNMLGMFVNTLVLRNKVDHVSSFSTFANSIKEYCLSAFQNQAYPFDELVKELNIKRDTSRNPLVDVMFIYQNNGYPTINFKDASAEYFTPDSNVSKFDLSLEVMPVGNELSLRFEYCTKLFDADFIKRLSSHYVNILNAILENQDIKIADIDMLSEQEKHQILYEFNDTAVEYPKDKTIVDLFEEQVEKTPDNIAVVFEDKKLTYRELNEKANQLARHLKENGVSNNSIVGIMLPRSLEIMIGFLGVLKAGACYIPIDPSFPKERVEYMLENSNASILLTLYNTNNINFNNVVDININTSAVYNSSNDNLKVKISQEDSSYIIYTSGSTGKPKGVVLSHKSLMNLTCHLNNNVDYLKINSQLAIASITTISFDIFLFESLISLQKGLEVIVANEKEQTNPNLLDELIFKHNIKAIQMTPSRMKVFIDNKEYMPHLSNLKYITLAGEALPDELKNKILDLGNITIYNGYGPSETTVFSTFTDVTSYSKVTIGKPLSNTYVYILDKDKKLCPIGIPGELYISGDGVGKGYINNESLTKGVFTKDIFFPNLTMYKTGDLAEWLPNGELNYISRVDNQIKIRGLRIELDEIQKWIVQYKDIKNVIISANTDKTGRQYLIAYLTVTNRISVNELKIYLGKHIPKYMIPTYFMVLNEFSYLPNGKIDKKALPLPTKDISYDKKYVAPTNKLEIEITQIFENLLSISPISINDNFFDIGGDSLLAMSLQLELLKLHINVSYSDIFMFPTVKELADNIYSSSKKSLSKIDINEMSKFDTILQNTTTLPTNLEYRNCGNLLLTGVTGFLGAHILDSFIKNETGKIYCLIRTEPGLTIEQKLLNKLHYYFDTQYDKLVGVRIIPIKADITVPSLDLTEESLKKLANDIDIVINSAAKVSHYGNYGDYKKVNVDGVQNLVDFCIKNNKRFYQISTLSVSGNSLIDDSYIKQSFTTDVDFNENNFYINQSLDNVYVRSKFEAEKVVLNGILNGLDGYIIRVGNLMNRFSDGKFQPNVNENAYINRLITFYKIGCIPDYLLSGYLELTPVDYCADAITKIIQYNCQTNRVFHILNHKHINIKYFINVLNKFYDKIDIVDNETFTQAIDKILNNPNNKNILAGLINDFDENKIIVYSSPVKINSKFTVEYLSKIHFNWTELDENYIIKFLKFFDNLNLLDRKDGI